MQLITLSTSTFSAALDEETVSHLHDVGFVHCCHLATLVFVSVFEGILSYTGACHPGDDLQFGTKLTTAGTKSSKFA